MASDTVLNATEELNEPTLAKLEQAGFSKTHINEIKLVVVGNVGSGKTTGIEAVSEIPVVGTEAKASEQDALYRKPSTTVAMEYGILQLQKTKIHLYGTPGQRRFNFMSSILCKNAAGMIVMIDNGHQNPISELDYFLNLHKKFLEKNPAVIAVTHFDDARTRTGLIDYHAYAMQHGFTIPVMRVDARQKREMTNLIMKLLIEIIRRRVN
ncbi:MAG: ATP/GTP-binding protein [Methylococcaceae bacterium]